MEGVAATPALIDVLSAASEGRKHRPQRRPKRFIAAFCRPAIFRLNSGQLGHIRAARLTDGRPLEETAPLAALTPAGSQAIEAGQAQDCWEHICLIAAALDMGRSWMPSLVKLYAGATNQSPVPVPGALANGTHNRIASPSGEEVSTISKAKEQELKRMNLNVPVQLHNSFKSATASQGLNMTDVLMDFIQSYVSKYGQSKKESKERRR